MTDERLHRLEELHDCALDALEGALSVADARVRVHAARALLAHIEAHRDELASLRMQEPEELCFTAQEAKALLRELRARGAM